MTFEQLKEQLAEAEATVRALHDELAETNRGLVALTLELEQRVDARTAELRKLNQELEARVEERTAQLRQANDNLQNLAHTAAHDLRSPLRAIRNFSSIVLEEHGSQLGSEGKSLLERVTRSAVQMQELLDDLLEYSRISQAELRLGEVSLRQAVQDTLALLDAEIRAKQAVVNVEQPLPDVIGHSATVVMLVNNFVSNALKFVPPGAQPTLRIWAEKSPHASNQFVRLCVQDNGIGIQPQDLDKLFRVFQRLQGRGTYPGTGLGLAIVRQGAERMGGQVGVESKPGAGSRFPGWNSRRPATTGEREPEAGSMSTTRTDPRMVVHQHISTHLDAKAPAQLAQQPQEVETIRGGDVVTTARTLDAQSASHKMKSSKHRAGSGQAQ